MQLGGAERVLLSMAKALPGAPVHTSFYEPDATYPEFRTLDIRPLPVDRIAFLRHHHRAALPLLPGSFSRLHLDVDVAVCGSAGWSHGARVSGRKVVYWYAPARWLYQADQYLSGRPWKRAAAATLAPWLRRWDRRAVASVDRHLALSSVIRDRVASLYGVDVELLPPPHGIDSTGPREPIADLDPGFLLCVSRLLPYKNVDVVLEALRMLPEDRLVVVGDGPERERLVTGAPAGTRFLRGLGDAQMRWLYASCRAVVSAAYEDFGLTPLEAAAFGRPSVVLGQGGFLDTVADGLTGVLFARAEPALLADGVRALDASSWDPQVLEQRAASFSEDRFVAHLRDVVAEESRR